MRAENARHALCWCRDIRGRLTYLTLVRSRERAWRESVLGSSRGEAPRTVLESAREKTMIARALGLAVSLAAAGVVANAERGKPGIAPAPCPDQAWEQTDPTFAALPGAKASFGRYDGGVYRI